MDLVLPALVDVLVLLVVLAAVMVVGEIVVVVVAGVVVCLAERGGGHRWEHTSRYNMRGNGGVHVNSRAASRRCLFCKENTR